MQGTQPIRVRFGAFELDLKSGELFTAATEEPRNRIVLARQPFQLLLMMAEREGAMVTREEIQQRFWPNDTIVEFDHSINVAIGKLRKALGDSADKPRYIATVSSRGYRLLVPVEWIAIAENSPGDELHPRADGVGTTDRSTATIQAGQTVSHYRVLNIIGGGGMGVVYRAEDLKLGRRVAIKFLPSETVSDSHARQRFEREAQTASSLNHPNICTIYEFGEHDGQPFLVMELLQGETLRDRLAAAQGEKGIPLDALLDIAVQVSGGLQAAHERGIIHRDIKPANIFLTDKGASKILDFGLAKLLEHSDQDVKTQVPPDLQAKTPPEIDLSRIGLAMGTAGYMSPEQVRGEKLDARTDLFSFGLVLYEMATGRRAFSGETLELVHNAILRQMPVRIRELNPEIPPRLETVIGAAMEKDRERRCQSASGIRADLLRLQRDMDSGRQAVQREVPSDPEMIVDLMKRNKWSLIALLVGSCVIAATVVAWLWRSGQHSPKLTEVALTQNSFETPVLDAAISPNGNLLAYADTSGLNLKVISSGEVHTLFTPEAARIVRIAWFPDSSNLLFASASPQGSQHQLWSGSIFGGAPHLLRSDADDASISADGSQLLFTNGAKDEIWEMDATGGNARKLTFRGGSYFYHPAWYAGRQRILYLIAHNLTDFGVEHASLESLDLKTGQSSTVLQHCSEFGLLPDGRLISAADSLLWKIPIDSQTALPTGQPVQVAGFQRGLISHPTVSTDGKRLVILKGNRDPDNGFGAVVFVADLEGKGMRLTNSRRLTVGGNAYAHDWTPDSQAVIFETQRNRRYGIYKQSLDRNVAELVVGGNLNTAVGRFSPDGSWFLYVGGNSASENLLMRMPASGGPSEEILNGTNMRNYYCTAGAANFCVVAEQEQDQLVFYAFDPAQKLPPGGIPRENLREVARTDYNPSDWDLSPDGTSIAMVRPSNHEGLIHVIPLQERGRPGRDAEKAPVHDVVVEGWTYLFDLNWAADGKGWYIGTRSDPAGSIFLYVDLKGHATIIQAEEGVEPTWVVPSRDGRHLAFSKTTFTENAWLLENF